MIRIPFEDIVRKVSEKSGLPQAEVIARVDAKCAQLAGLISKDGAAHIIANELGITLVQQGGRLKIRDAFPGMRAIELAGKVTQKYEAREFARQDGSKGKMAAFMLGDDTGSIRVVAWGDKADSVAPVAEGSIVLLQQAQVRENNRGYKEVHLGDNSAIVQNPAGIEVGTVVAASGSGPAATRKTIKDIGENDQNVEIVGTIVQVFDPKYFEVCPQCNKRSRPDPTGQVICPEHGAVQPAWGMVGNCYLDDGSGSIRVVFFRNQLERLAKKTTAELIAFKDAPERFEAIKTDLLGTIVKVTGRASRNQFFDRLEFVAQLVHEASAEEELARLQARA